LEGILPEQSDFCKTSGDCFERIRKWVNKYFGDFDMDLREQIDKAKQLINDNKLKEAENILSAVDDKYAVFELARIKQIQGNDNEAEKKYKRVLELDPLYNKADLELARIYHRQRRTDLAMKYYKKFTDKIKDNADVYKEIGRLYESLGDLDNAVSSIGKASDLYPDDIMTSFELGIAYREAGNDTNQ
jgi:tetratricopeptide (TPR) repeat protein